MIGKKAFVAAAAVIVGVGSFWGLSGAAYAAVTEYVGHGYTISEIHTVSGIDYYGETLSVTDTRGFHGDGYVLRTKACGAEDIESIKNNGLWQPLPLSDNLNTFLYQPCDEALGFPVVQNGYWFFYDRHSEAEDRYSDAELFDRPSFDFTFAVYDTDKNILYVCDYDT